MHAAKAGRVESRAVPERGADDGVVDRRHVLEHVELAVMSAMQSLARRRSRIAGSTSSPATCAVACSSSVQANFSQSSDDW